jgi:hypothetical protein
MVSMKEKPLPQPERRRKRAAEGPNLLGENCVHDYAIRYRGYMMCSKVECAALANMDGSALTKAEWRALLQQLRTEGLDV